MDFWTTTKRVVRYGVAGFVRNGFVSLAAILIMIITLFSLAALTIGGAALNATLTALTEKVDVSVYFTTSAPENHIREIESQLKALP